MQARLLFLPGFVGLLMACQPSAIQPNTLLPTPALYLAPQDGSVVASWQNLSMVRCGTGLESLPVSKEAATYEVFASLESPTTLRKVATLDGAIHEYVFRNVPNGQPLFVQLRAIGDNATATQSGVQTTIPGKTAPITTLFASLSYGQAGAWSANRAVVTTPGGLNLLEQGKVVRQIAANAQWPTLSPDGEKIAYIAYGPASSDPKLLVEAWASGKQTILSTGTLRLNTPAEWAADGQSLAFVTAAPSAQLWRIPITGALPTPLTQASYLGYQSFGQSQVSWTPDQSAVVVARTLANDQLNQPSASELVRVSATTGDTQVLVSASWQNWLPALSPDGQHLAFISDRSGYQAIWLYDLSTRQVRQLTNKATVLTYINRLSWLRADELTFFADVDNHPAIQSIKPL